MTGRGEDHRTARLYFDDPGRTRRWREQADLSDAPATPVNPEVEPEPPNGVSILYCVPLCGNILDRTALWFGRRHFVPQG